MNLTLRIPVPDQDAARVRAVPHARLEQAALAAVLRVAAEGASDQPATAGIDSDRSAQDVPGRTPAEAVARMRQARAGNVLPEGVTIRDLMTFGRA